MQIEMEDVGSKLSEEDVSSFEQRIGFSLPNSYRTFLLRFNGGFPSPACFLIPNCYDPEGIIQEFYGIIPGKYNDLEESIEDLEGSFPKGFIPIASDPGGSAILLSLEGKTRGKIYFWDHELAEPEECTDNVEDYPNIFFVANDFDEFLNQLKDD